MNILIISRQEIPEVIKYYFQNYNTNAFYSRGPIKCKNILEKKKIHYIFLFLDNSLKKILDDLLLVLNQKAVPVIIFSNTGSQNFQKQFKHYYADILWGQSKEQILSAINDSFQRNSDFSPPKKKFSNLIFKNFFKKKNYKNNKLQLTKGKLFPLFSSLNISKKEKNELLSDFQNPSKKRLE